MTYGSVCSGIESASIAWEPLGWTPAWFAEIEPFPSAVLARRWPKVANMGNMCRLPALIDAGVVPAPDVLVGGTPCQAFSVAGMRKGLADDRGQLTIKYVEVANAIDRKRPAGSEAIIVWENVPGVLSDKTNAFGCFLAALVGEDDPLQPTTERPATGKSCSLWRWDKKKKRHFPRWSNAGIVYGPQRVAAWRILDAQYFGVAQRRRRVFVVASARNGFDPEQVLFEFEGVRRDTPPSREEGPVVAALTAGGVGTCGADDNQAQAGHLVSTGLNDGETARALTACKTATGRLDPNEQTFVVACLDASYGKLQGASGQDLNHGHSHLVVHGTQDPIILEDKAFPLGRNGGRENAVCFDTTQITSPQNRSNPKAGDPCHPLASKAHPPAIAFSGRNRGAEPKVNRPERPPLSMVEKVGALDTVKPWNVVQGLIVRRLTPRECERLQGFPDDHTLIDRASKKKIEQDVYKYFLRTGCSPEEAEAAARHPDGPRYKAIGNSKAVPVIKWLGERIAAACS